MARFELTPALRADYVDLFETCKIVRDHTTVDKIASRIQDERDRYDAVGAPLGIPWFAVGVIHAMETGLSFERHLHNGDPLTARTVRVPAGRPPGNPPFTWEVSARDALVLEGFGRWRDWNAAGLLFKLEGYNGWGYRRNHPQVKTPYLWSFSNHYTSGKYVADGQWSNTAVSQQCGAAVLLRCMVDQGQISLEEGASPAAAIAPDAAPLIGYWTRGPEVAGARELQQFLNHLPGIAVSVDGKPGEGTSTAVRRALGHYLVGDPRGA